MFNMVELTPIQIEKFMSKIIKTGNCWEWIEHKDPYGYGQFWLINKLIQSHRISYELFKEKFQ